MWFHLLTLLFVGLKLTGHITWAWWYVVAPSIFIGSVQVFILALLGLIIVLNPNKIKVVKK